MQALGQDLKHGLRRLIREPASSAVLIATIAVAIAANAAIFGAVRPVVSPELPYPEADRIMRIWGQNLERGWTRSGVSWQDARDWASSSETFESLGVYTGWEGNLRTDQEPLRVQYALTEPAFFEALGVAPQLGRTLLPDEIEAGRGDVVVLSHGLWTRAFGADPRIIGDVVNLAGRPVEVVGVMPPDFAYPSANIDAWKPFGMAPDEAGGRDSYWVSAIGRLAPDATVESAREEMLAIGGRLEAEYPETNQGMRPYVEPLADVAVLDARQGIYLLWAAVGLLLAVACGNVAVLLLARGQARTDELAVRASLGADRRTLIRQLLIESGVLAAIGGVVGLVAAVPAVRAVEGLMGSRLAFGASIEMDATVILYTVLVTAVAALGFGLLPALRVSGLAGEALRSARGRVGRRSRLGGALVAAQLALAVVIMVGSGLIGRSLVQRSAVDPGYPVENALTFRVAPSWEGTERADAAVLFRRIRDQLTALPGVTGVAAINRLPLSGRQWSASWTDQRKVGDPALSAFARVVQPGFLETLGVSLLQGRSLRPGDNAASEPVAVVSAAAAAEYWPEGDALGSYISLAPGDDRAPWVRVVGVVDDVEIGALDAERDAVVYTPFEQSVFGHFGDWGMDFLIRTDGDLGALAGPVRTAVAGVAPSLPAFGIGTLEQSVAAQLDDTRALTLLMGLFAAVALFLACLGVYGMLAYDVGSRVPAIGVRMAVGADARTVLAGVLARGAVLAGAGVAAGLGTAAVAGRWMRGVLFGVQPVDPTTYALTAAVLLLAALAASGIPAWRASRVDPARALRGD